MKTGMPEFDNLMNGDDGDEIGFGEGSLRPVSKEKWTLLDGIKCGQTRTYLSPEDGARLFSITLTPEDGLQDPVLRDAIFRVLVRYAPDGAIKEWMIDFSEPHLSWQPDQKQPGDWS